ncbi:MAG: hypothetical protein KQH57_07700 [Actinomycetales bacterium]|nr:hypothetical protein [Actinomycetales bacterium]
MGLFSRGRTDGSEPLDLPYDPGSAEGLAARWTRWGAGIGPMHSPFTDPTGEDAALDQPADVWFLAGTFGGSADRAVTVPAGRPIFLPAVNMWDFPAYGPLEDLPRSYGSAELDDEPVEPIWISTPVPFLVAGARLNLVTKSRKPVPTVVAGWWVHMPPPLPGPHLLHVTGGDGHGFTLDLTFRLTVTEDS